MATFKLGEMDAWVRQTEQRMLAVAKESTQRTISKAQSRAPIDTGFLRASVRISTESMPQIIGRGAAGQTYNYNSGEVTAVLAGAQLGQTLFVGWSAAYAIYIEHGHSKQAPTGFVGISVLEWPATVAQVTQELKSRAGVGQ